MRGPPGQYHEHILEGCGASGLFERGERVAGKEPPRVDNSDAIGEGFDFRQGVRSEEQGSVTPAEDFGFEKAAEFGGRYGVQAARRLI